MHLFTMAVALATSISAASAQNGYKGFNSGNIFSTGVPKQQVDFAYEMRAAQQLPGTNGAWTSVRLYTMIQAGTVDTPISAIPAAIETKSTLLLGLWASIPPEAFEHEINALKTAINQYGNAFTDLVTGISVGSEDLYRSSIGEVGASSQQLIDYISKVRAAVAGTPLQRTPIGHVDTFNVFVDGAGSAVVSAIDFIGMDAYPYYQTNEPGGNNINNANATFWSAYSKTVASAQGKPVWVAETGWPVIGDTLGEAVAGVDNAHTYWHETVCSFLRNGINMYYFQLQSAQGKAVNPDWGLKGPGDLMNQPLRFDLSC